MLDRGWADRFPSIWSFPFAEGGLMQFGFADEVDLLPRELEMLAAVADDAMRLRRRRGFWRLLRCERNNSVSWPSVC